MLPAVIGSIWLHGLDAVRVFGLTISIAVALDALFARFVLTKDHPWNWNTVVLAMLFACFMPHGAPWWLILIGCFVMIGVGKHLYGGIGAFPIHPVAMAIAVLLLSWPSAFDYTGSVISMDWGVKMVEPIRQVQSVGTIGVGQFELTDLFMGKQVAGLGNAMVLFLLIGGFVLLITREINWQIPFGFIVGNVVLSVVLHAVSPDVVAGPWFNLLAGSAVFGAFFLATESTTSPVNSVPMLIYGLLGGCLLVLIQAFSSHTDGIVWTILLMNISFPLLDRMTPKVKGLERTHA